MPEPTREELLRERESFNLKEHLQSLKDASAKIVAVTEQEIHRLADELTGDTEAAQTPTESEKPNAD